jgi:5-methyltetrahydrofolate--homocysteine methyltransferase
LLERGRCGGISGGHGGPAGHRPVDSIQADGNYSEAYFTHGLGANREALAEYLHLHIRRKLGFAGGQGKRYSWVIPVPELEDHRKVFDLLPAVKKLGMSLTSACQLVPEQSTAAIIVHHLQSKYFSIGEMRPEQLLKAQPIAMPAVAASFRAVYQ